MKWELSDLVGNLDIADMLGVTPGAVVNMRKRDDSFPDPLVKVSHGTPLFSRVHVLAWARRTGRTS